MNDTQPPRKDSPLSMLLGAVVLAVLVAALYLMIADGSNGSSDRGASSPEGSALQADLAQGEVAAFLVHKAPKEVPDLSFTDAEGKERSLADWKGKTVLVNLWATWCGPCREEMPALANLQKTYGGDDFEVVAISLDQKGAPVAKAFLDEINVRNLAVYVDKSTEALALLKGVGLPTTILLDPEGKELGRLLGPAVWDSADAKKLIEAALARDEPGS